MKIIFIADYFLEDGLLGGGELNNHEFIKVATELGNDVIKMNSVNATPEFIEENIKERFIISNFVILSQESKDLLTEKAVYLIYEHDHKYLPERNPAIYLNFIAPKEKIINRELYQNAQAILCQSRFHASVVRANLHTKNIRSLGGNLWSEQSLDKLEEISKIEKQDKCSVMDSTIPHKNTTDAVRYCRFKEWDYDLISNLPYHEFLEALGKNERFVFFPQTPETLSRVVVEARMMGMQVITNDKVGATKETWFSEKGQELIDIMREKRTEVPKVVLDMFLK